MREASQGAQTRHLENPAETWLHGAGAREEALAAARGESQGRPGWPQAAEAEEGDEAAGSTADDVGVLVRVDLRPQGGGHSLGQVEERLVPPEGAKMGQEEWQDGSPAGEAAYRVHQLVAMGSLDPQGDGGGAGEAGETGSPVTAPSWARKRAIPELPR